MSDRTNIIYRYDGTYEGLLCCVFESYEKREIPSEIITDHSEQISLFPVTEIVTDTAKSDRIKRAIPVKMSDYLYEFIQRAFLSCHPQKDILILKFMYLGFRHGAKVIDMLADNTVNAIFKAVNNVNREAHLYREFIRFSQHNDVLVSVIEPKNIVLPIILNHFTDRLKNESFLIFDKTHHMALVYYKYKAEIVPIEDFTIPAADDSERQYRKLWKAFYNIIGIEERYNPKCRMTMMPKRYWKYMTEFAEMFGEDDDSIDDSIKVLVNDKNNNTIEKQY